MTYLLSIDPGLNTGAAIGFYDAVTPYRLIERFQIHRGATGFARAVIEGRFSLADEMVVESFSLREENDFAANLTPVRIEGAIELMLEEGSYLLPDCVAAWQPPSDKGGLIGYSDKAASGTKAMRQRERFNFLERFGLFKDGTENDDSNDAITHALVYLRRSGHRPTQNAFWPRRERPVVSIAPSLEPTF